MNWTGNSLSGVVGKRTPLKSPLLQTLVCIPLIILCLASCNKKQPGKISRPIDPWAFRSVLDKQPRMLTIALDSECYIAYDLAHCNFYKAWKGGVMLEGAAYTDKKNVQPTSWGKSYFSGNYPFKWVVEKNGKPDSFRIINTGYLFKENQIYLGYNVILSSNDTVHIEERPEFIKDETGKPALERLFKTSVMPPGVNVSIRSADTLFTLAANKTAPLVTWFTELPAQFPPKLQEEYDAMGKYWMEKSDCFTCHEVDKATVGPSLRQIAERYQVEEHSIQYLIHKVQTGGTGVWGSSRMTPHPLLKDGEIKTMLDYVLSLKPKEKTANEPAAPKKLPVDDYIKPGFGAALDSVFPGYDVVTIHKAGFHPKVGGLAFLPGKGLLITTWDSIGGVYLMSGAETGDTNKVAVKRIAAGLAEPLGITVVDGEIFVLQKQELTHLVDLDGDGIIDEYRVVCNSFGATADFHEFAFGLAYKDNHFYVTLGMAMRLMSGEKQQPDRGRTIKIAMDGSYEWVNYGLRMPNGIGMYSDGELFETDNNGEWNPANKFIHVKKGVFSGMPWGLPDSVTPPPTSPPAIYLPENEIGNSPSEPVLMKDGPYKGQMIHGDVSNGGIKRDFLEKVNGEYQGAAFRFMQGLEAGVNRLCWGPDGALYAGEIGMVGGWSYKEKKYGLQRLKYNGKPVFDMLAVRAKPKGFEIEFTDALPAGKDLAPADFLIKQWWYQPTARYGGPKMDLENLSVTRVEMSADRKRAYLEIAGLKKGHVVYFSLPERIKNAAGQSLWSSEAWYTLNNIPD